MTPEQFIALWKNNRLSEWAGVGECWILDLSAVFAE